MRRVILFLLLFLLATPASAFCTGKDRYRALPPETRAALEAKAAADPWGTGLFWKAEKPGSTLYLLGTFHLNDPAFAGMIGDIKPEMEASDRVYVEITREQEAEVQKSLYGNRALLLNPQPPGLIARLGPELWGKLEPKLAAAGVPASVATQLQPWFAELLIAYPDCMRQDTLANGLEETIDGRVRTQAEALGKPLVALDTVRDALDALSSGTIDEQIASLKLTVTTIDGSADTIHTLTDFYLAQNVRLVSEWTRYDAAHRSGLAREIVNAIDMRMIDNLITPRNAAWMDKLMEAAGGRTLFVAVGALHLPMEKGLLAQLAARGYRLTRLELPSLAAR